jgi:hypothetical protein
MMDLGTLFLRTQKSHLTLELLGKSQSYSVFLKKEKDAIELVVVIIS